jgi:hypothetical protein
MKKIVSYIFATLLLVSCSKQKNQEYTLTGRFMQSCETPAANKDGLIYFSGGGLLNNPSTTLEFTTDENGYFTVKHNEPFTEFSVRTSAAHSVLEVNSIPGDDNDLGDVYLFPPSASYYLHLQVSNSYTSLDTLTFSNGGSPGDGRPAWFKIPGPFSSQIIDTVPVATNQTVMPISFNNFNSGNFPTTRIAYYINEYSPDNAKFIEIPIKYCDSDYQNIYLVID